MVHASSTVTSPTSLLEGEDGGVPDVTIVVTIFNEERSIPELVGRLRETLDAWGRRWEVVLVDDGSSDGSRALLRAEQARDHRVRVILLKRNFGQHPAMAAGMTAARGGIVVTMDGDLQNDPADVPKLVAAIEEQGVEVASGLRGDRADALMSRRLPSRAINGMLRRLTRVEITDYGCAFNAYRRSAFEPVLHAIGRQKFTKALILSTGASVTEVELNHQARDGDRSRYSRMRLVRLALHVLTGFFPQPIQWAGIVLGIVCSSVALVVGVYGIGFWISQSNFPGLTFLAALVFGGLAVQGFILGLLGEYVQRIQRDVERRPLYVIDEVLE
jgi:glycosyltransferase involved in cell wall biosynthesis